MQRTVLTVTLALLVFGFAACLVFTGSPGLAVCVVLFSGAMLFDRTGMA